jgi:hypothetical protein
MNKVRLFPGDTAVINGAMVTADRTVRLTSDVPIERVPAPGLSDLPETALRTQDLWNRSGHRLPMTLRQDLRCPCGSVYVRQSETHHSCQSCGRLWGNDEVPGKEPALQRGW